MHPQLKRIVIIGPESTGKSTLTQALAQHFDACQVREFAREYLEQLGRPYNEADLLQIAQGQIALEDAIAKDCEKPLLFCDTDLYVIKVWSENKYGRCAPEILQQIAIRHYDFYLLTNIDMPWQDDPLREHPDAAMRAYFFRIYSDIVQQSGVPFAMVSGNEEERLQAAVVALQGL